MVLARVFLAAVMAVSLAACGFTPIYKYDGTVTRLTVRSMDISGDAIDRVIARNLNRQISVSPEADTRIAINVTRQIFEMQKDSDGIARRFEVRHAAQLSLTRQAAGEDGVTQVFRLTQYMTRGDSAVDEMSQLRRLDDLAARDLATQIIAFIAANMSGAADR